MDPSSLKQFFNRDVGMESSLHCLLDEEKIRSWISERVAGRKLSNFGGGAIGDSYGSGERVGVNLVRIRSILSWKNSRKVFARADVSDLSGIVFEEVRWRIVLRVFQRERGLDEVADTRLEKKSDLTLLIKLRTMMMMMRWCSVQLPITDLSTVSRMLP